MCYKTTMISTWQSGPNEHKQSSGDTPKVRLEFVESETATERYVGVTVLALIPEYHQVEVVDGMGRHYSLTEHTQGINLAELKEGQKLACRVNKRLPRVLAAAVLA